MNFFKNRVLIYCGLVVFFYAIVGFWIIPLVIKRQIPEQSFKYLGTAASVREVHLNPFTFELGFTNLSLPDVDSANNARLKLADFEINLSPWYLVKKEIHVQSLSIHGLSFFFHLDVLKKHNWNVKTAPQKSEVAEQTNNSPWVVQFDRLDLSDSRFRFLDETRPQKLDLSSGSINLSLLDLSTSIGATTQLKKLNIHLGEKGDLEIGGQFDISPLRADIKVKAERIPLNFLSSYLSEKTYLRVEKGFLNTESSLVYKEGQILLDGTLLVSDFAMTESRHNKTAFQWANLRLKHYSVSGAPWKVRLENMSVEGPQFALSLRADGTLSTQDFMRAPQKTTSVKSSNKSEGVNKNIDKDKESSAEVSLDQLSISKGVLQYADQQIKPHFRARVDNFGGEIGPLVLNSNQKTKIHLNGRVNGFGQFKAAGFVEAFAPKAALDLDVHFTNIEMTTFSPYSGKFAGYEISKGKLFLDLNYKLKNKKIKGQNHVLLDQFTLGDKVDSQDATGLPVKLALALLKDRKGQLNFELPVEGDVDSPAFSFGGLIWTALKNMIINIAAAPFDFIKGLVGGGDDLQALVFAPGQAVLAPEQLEKIKKLAEVLSERPQLSVEVQGQFCNLDAELVKSSSHADEKLRALAIKRSQAVQGAMIQAGIPGEKVYLLAPQKSTEDVTESRAQLSLKAEN